MGIFGTDIPNPILVGAFGEKNTSWVAYEYMAILQRFYWIEEPCA